MGLILNSFFFPTWRLNVFCCVCGGSWVHLDGMNRWEKIGLCFRRRPLWKWAVSTQGGSGGSPKTGSDGEQGSLGGTVGPGTSVVSFRLLHVSLLYELKNTSELKQNASWGFKQRELAFKSFIIQKQWCFLFHCLLIWELFCVQLWPKRQKHPNLYFFLRNVTKPASSALIVNLTFDWLMRLNPLNRILNAPLSVLMNIWTRRSSQNSLLWSKKEKSRL